MPELKVSFEDDKAPVYYPGDRIVCSFEGCSEIEHSGTVDSYLGEKYLIVQFDDRPFREVVPLAKVVRE